MSRLSQRIENFKNAFILFSSTKDAYSKDTNDITKLALIHSYEIVIELGWKVLKDYLSEINVKTDSSFDTIKEAFNKNIIINGQIWINMIKDRNVSSHEYNVEKVDLIAYKISTSYFDELNNFYNKSEVING